MTERARLDTLRGRGLLSLDKVDEDLNEIQKLDRAPEQLDAEARFVKSMGCTRKDFDKMRLWKQRQLCQAALEDERLAAPWRQRLRPLSVPQEPAAAVSAALAHLGLSEAVDEAQEDGVSVRGALASAAAEAPALPQPGTTALQGVHSDFLAELAARTTAPAQPPPPHVEPTHEHARAAMHVEGPFDGLVATELLSVCSPPTLLVLKAVSKRWATMTRRYLCSPEFATRVGLPHDWPREVKALLNGWILRWSSPPNKREPGTVISKLKWGGRNAFERCLNEIHEIHISLSENVVVFYDESGTTVRRSLCGGSRRRCAEKEEEVVGVGMAVLIMFSTALTRLILRDLTETGTEQRNGASLPSVIAALQTNESVRELSFQDNFARYRSNPANPTSANAATISEWTRTLADALRINKTIMYLDWSTGQWSLNERLHFWTGTVTLEDEEYLVRAWRSNSARPPRGRETAGTVLDAREKADEDKRRRKEALDEDQRRRKEAQEADGREDARRRSREAEEQRRQRRRRELEIQTHGRELTEAERVAEMQATCSHQFDFIGGNGGRCHICGKIVCGNSWYE
jgi:hypothetical protein